MPGILPMKVIRVGSNAQVRIAQACDRCRSKKIRCDGVRPCCTQCANVGFECKTSDKLSRRAFPRGYTESLEDRVRGLEAEVRELKGLLDEKDEKIDMLSRLHSFSTSRKNSIAPISPPEMEPAKAEPVSPKETFLQIESPEPAPPSVHCMGPSSTAALIESFDRKAQESDKPCPAIRVASFAPNPRSTASQPTAKITSKIPPRLLSDQYVNIFFQEWAPLLPVLHRPTFLRIYEDYLADPEAGHWHSKKQAIAQLFLVFDIAALSSVSRIKQGPTSYEAQWRKAIQSTSSLPSLPTLQCHVLAELHYLLKGDYSHLARHRAIAVSMCHQLGLHQNQKYLSITVLESETRKKTFWSQYVLDKFASAASGTPMLLHEADISAEYPADVDDENLSAQGFSPALPGEVTKISSALALFKAARILAKVLEELYPASGYRKISLTRLHTLSDEVDQWSRHLPSHLRLRFENDKPSTGTISCRSPLLSLTYFFIRSLIHRPVVCHGTGNEASASLISLADSAKHIMQILELLEERRMNYTFTYNKSELLVITGFSLLWPCLELPADSKIVKDNQKSLTVITQMLTRDSPTMGNEFLSVVVSLVPPAGRSVPVPTRNKSQADINPGRLLNAMPAPPAKQKSPYKQLQAITSRISSFNNKTKAQEGIRRATVPQVESNPPPHQPHRAPSNASLCSTRSAPVAVYPSPPKLHDLEAPLNLDYLPIGEEEALDDASPRNNGLIKTDSNESTWEQLLANMDNGHSNIYAGIYGGVSSPVQTLGASHLSLHRFSVGGEIHAGSLVSPPHDWADEEVYWPGSVSAIDLTSPHSFPPPPVPQSVLSFSEESLSSSDENMVFSAACSNNGSTATTARESSVGGSSFCGRAEGSIKGIAMPNLGEEFDFDELDVAL